MQNNGKEIVTLVRCKRYSYEEVRESVISLLEPLGGLKSFIKPGESVLIKPNLLAAASPEEAVTTHPLVVQVLAELAKEAGAAVYIGDSPASGSANRVAETAGIGEAAKKAGAELISFTGTHHVNNVGKKKRTIPLASVLHEMDFVINAAKLKTHTLTGLTAAVKNTYGCIPGSAKGRLHFEHPLPMDFAHLLLDIYLAVKPGLSILDAVIAMEGMGPRSGRPRQGAILAASTNGLALDCVAAEITGFAPGQVTTLAAASERELIGSSLSHISIQGLSLEEARIEGFDRGAVSGGRISALLARFPSSWLRNRLQHSRRPFPVVNSEKCTGCEICYRHCPPQIITVEGKKAIIRREQCIRCYCCQELCPHKAIDL